MQTLHHRCSLLAFAAIFFGVPVAVGNDHSDVDMLPPGRVLGIVGQHVRASEGADAGRLWDVLVDRNGEPRAVVIDYGGVLGVGRRKIAIAWQAVRFAPDDPVHPIRLMLSRRQMGAVPRFSYGSVPVKVGDGH